MAKAKKLPSGSWRVRVYAGKVNGVRQYKSFTAPTERKANLMALEWQEHYREVTKDTANMTVDEAMEKYINSKDGILSPSTINGYEAVRRNYIQQIKDKQLNKLSNSIIQDFINTVAKDKSAKTVHNIYGLLSSVIKTYHPALKLNISLPKKSMIHGSILNKEELKKLFEVISGTEMEIPVLLAVWLGMRASEIGAIEWNDIDFQNKVIYVKRAKVRNKDNEYVIKDTTKTESSSRILALPDYILNVLKVRKGQDKNIVNIQPSDFWKRLRIITRKNGIKDIRFHDLRHTNASIMLALNVPDKYAMERGGWATNNIMKSVYQHTFDETRVIVDKAIDSYFEVCATKCTTKLLCINEKNPGFLRGTFNALR